VIVFRVLTQLVTGRPRAVLVAALIFVAACAALGRGAADHLGSGGTEDPRSQSSRAAAVLDAEFPASRPNLLLLVSGRHGEPMDDPELLRQGTQLTLRLAFDGSVAGVTSYFRTRSPDLRSTDGRSALILAHVIGDEDAVKRTFDRITPEYRAGTSALQVRLGGLAAIRDASQQTLAEDLRTAELIALPITLLILVLAFGGLVAAALPIVVALVAVIGTSAVLRALAAVTDVSIFAQNLTTALGLGLAIDYALFIVRRYREELARGAEPRDALAATLQSAGRTVVFSALTVGVSLAAMLVFPLYFLRSMAYAGISVVLIAATGAVVILPALLAVLGRRVDALSLRRRTVSTGRHVQRQANPGGAGWRVLAGTVMRSAPVFAIGTAILLVVLGLPFLSVHFGASDDRQLPVTAEARQVQQVLRDTFATSSGAVVDVVVSSAGTPAGTRERALATLSSSISRLPHVAAVATPLGTFAGGRLTAPPTVAELSRTVGNDDHLSVLPGRDVEEVSAQSEDLVRSIRALPSTLHVLVAGRAASLVDSKQAIAARLPIAGAMIVITTLLLVFLLTGSVLLPLQAVVLNALSLTAMFGVVVWVFQDGHLHDLLNFTPTGSIDATLPVLMFCVAFGLSMDYGVFLLARMHEEHERTGDNPTAVAFGLQRSGGIITAAALILGVVLVAIGTSRITNTKMLGLGVATAVLTDAVVVRCLLVPSVMALTGRATWWAPRPLRRLQQRFGLREGPSAPGREERGRAVPEPRAAERTRPTTIEAEGI
jgi:RND superfamily putative drug exporter